ncbi:lysis system i-spanin subunit Rz [Parvibaculum sp.]|jgi:prophage endopeptidase|uniref:lysis system i-spanin subunit Rz n=1 Tax=Parvibaculum sp. TaxID=2024848 RepID=UPI0027330948|nr:lysis system i-spanin subunit Rz [Parvibaculum sp.]MDP3327226.1 lysis system i-spanin subunit Rz [Parvibaculum sp.]
MNISSLVRGATGLASKAAGGWYLYAIIAGVAFGVGGVAAWKTQDVIYGKQVAELNTKVAQAEAAHGEDLRIIAIEASADLLAKMAEIERLQGLISNIEAKSFKEMQNARAENDRLRDDVRDGIVRLRIAVRGASPSNPADGELLPGAGSDAVMGDGTSVELSPEAGQAVLDLRAGLIVDDAKLRACQAISAAQRTAPPSVSTAPRAR